MDVSAGKTSKPLRKTVTSRAVRFGQPASIRAVNILRIPIKVISERTKTSEITVRKPEQKYTCVNPDVNAIKPVLRDH